MSKIFKIDVEVFPVYLTCDSTLYTCDDTNITCDMTIEGTYPYRLKILTSYTTQNFKIFLKNERTNETAELEVLYHQYDGEYLVAYFDYPFEEGDSFEIRVIDANVADDRKNLIARDKGYATMQDDLENFKLVTSNNNGKTRMK